MNQDALQQAGLTINQANAYVALLKSGALSPAVLAEKINETRTNSYAICAKLEELQLVKKVDAKKTQYIAESPINVKKLLIEKQKALKKADVALASVLPELLSTYKLTNDQPGVLYLEGTDSLQKIYDDLIFTGEPLYIFPSALDRKDAEVARMIDSQIARQRTANIKTHMLIRPEVAENFTPDELLEIRTAPLEPLEAQIMIFGPNVVTTTFNQGVVSTVLTSSLVAATFLKIFQALWALGSEVGTKNDLQSD